MALSGKDVHILTLAQQAQAVIAGQDGDALKTLALIGGSGCDAQEAVLLPGLHKYAVGVVAEGAALGVAASGKGQCTWPSNFENSFLS